MPKLLRLAPDIRLLIEAITQTFGILGKRGTGKTYTASVMAEEMLAAGAQVVVLDPLDVWWGLRASADGTADSGHPITIMGGSHADLPLNASAGEVIADFVVEHRASVILSLRHLSKNEQRRFVEKFCERLYHRKGEPQYRQAMHLFIDEADAFAPQRVPSGQERMLGAVDDLVRRGRSSGIGVTLVTQRSAAINKDVLTQIEVLIAHRTLSPQDRKALEAWIEAHDVDEQRAEFMRTIASLGNGEIWFWSPGWLDVFQRAKVRQRKTYDSSSTPKPGERPPTDVALKPVDIERLRERLASTLEKAKENDPQVLRRENVRLQRELAAATKAGNGTPADVRRAVAEGKREQAGVIKTLEADIVARDKRAASTIRSLQGVAKSLADQAAGISALVNGSAFPASHEVAKAEPHATRGRTRPPSPKREPATARVDTPAEIDRDISRAQQSIIDAIAALAALGIEQPERRAVAPVAGYRHSSGHFKNMVSALKAAGVIDYPSSGSLALTSGGTELVTMSIELAGDEDVQRFWMSLCNGTQRKIMEILLEHWPASVLRGELAAAATMQETSGHFKNTISSLKTLGALTYPEPGTVRASDLLFPEGLA